MNPGIASQADPATHSQPRAATMKAVVKAKAGPGVEIHDVPVPAVGAGQILLRVLRAGVCGTDLHIWEWDAWASGRMRPPVTIGHEFVGEIVEIGPDVTGLKIGERVSCESHIVCQHCIACRTGNAPRLREHEDPRCRRRTAAGRSMWRSGANAWRAPANDVDRGPGDHGAARQRGAHRVRGDLSACRIAVTGCGPIGLFAVGVARAAGSRAGDRERHLALRLELAKKMTRRRVIDPSKENFVERVRE
jgi:threonine 3-dehydrogenase